MSLISCKSISKQYPGQTALQDVNLDINPGEFWALKGQSGSGKSTLLAMIGLLDEPSNGEVSFNGEATSALSFSRRCQLRNQHFGYVFQQFNLLGGLSNLDNVMMPLSYSTLPKQQHQKLAIEALEKVGMADRAKDQPDELSGGQQQRVAIARAIVTEPEVLLADEPTGNLDSQNADEVMALFQQLNQSGTTLVIATHHPDYAAMASHHLLLKDGQIQS